MKVTVNNQDKEEVINWNKVQLVIHVDNDFKTITQVLTDQSEVETHHFAGVRIYYGYYSTQWKKSVFKPFHGSITLQND